MTSSLRVLSALQAGRRPPGYCPACLDLWCDRSRPQLPHPACRSTLLQGDPGREELSSRLPARAH